MCKNDYSPCFQIKLHAVEHPALVMCTAMFTSIYEYSAGPGNRTSARTAPPFQNLNFRRFIFIYFFSVHIFNVDVELYVLGGLRCFADRAD